MGPQRQPLPESRLGRHVCHLASLRVPAARIENTHLYRNSTLALDADPPRSDRSTPSLMYHLRKAMERFENPGGAEPASGTPTSNLVYHDAREVDDAPGEHCR